MGKRGRFYSPEFKEEAVRLVHSCEEKYRVAKIARDLDVSAETSRSRAIFATGYLSSEEWTSLTASSLNSGE